MVHKSEKRGVRFSAAVALMTVVPAYAIYCVAQPMPGIPVIEQIAFDGILLLILGAVVAFIHRGQKSA